MPMLVRVAPVTVSTPSPWALTMRSGMSCTAASAMRAVSRCSITRTEEMALSENSVSTVMLSNLPSAAARYVPGR